jgi:phenylacetate-CoA ligase
VEDGTAQRMLIYRVGDRLRGWSVFDCVRELEAMERLDAAGVLEVKNGLIRELVRHAYVNVPFYRSIWQSDPRAMFEEAGIAGLARLPCVTKQSFMAAGRSALDQSRDGKEFVVGRSSGSTGRRFVYYKDRKHQSWWIATNLLAWKWAGWRPGNRWLRLQFRGHRSWSQRLEDSMFRCLNMPIDRLDSRFMEAFTERAIRFNPVLLRGYAGGTYVYARWLLEQGERRLRPRAVALTGDTLYPHYREAITQAFDAPVFDSYGGEGMTVGIQCEEGTYHVPPVVHVDLIPEGPAMSDGQPNRIILTSLTNTAMPFIRYDIGDLGIPMDDPCACGNSWPGLKRIIGRDTDIVRTAAGRNLVAHHFNNVLRVQDGIDEFQVRQKERSSITLSLVVNDSFRRKSDETVIRLALQDLLGEGTSLDINYVNELPIPSSGKRRYIISQVAEASSDAP